MKNIKRFITILAVVGVIGAVGFAYAEGFRSPADIAAAISGRSVEEVTKERAAGKTYGTIAKEAGKLDEFKNQMLEQKKAILDQRVKDGNFSQQQADSIYNSIKINQATCDGTGSAKIGKTSGACFGNEQGVGSGKGQGMGRGFGSGKG